MMKYCDCFDEFGSADIEFKTKQKTQTFNLTFELKTEECPFHGRY